MRLTNGVPCKVWDGCKNADGYGRINRDGRVQNIHRYTMEKHLGRKLEPTECVLHDCDNPPCYELAHLYVGTKKQNARDKVARGRHISANALKTECKNGHPFNSDNTYLNKNTGQRTCKPCRNARARKRYRKE